MVNPYMRPSRNYSLIAENGTNMYSLVCLVIQLKVKISENSKHNCSGRRREKSIMSNGKDIILKIILKGCVQS